MDDDNALPTDLAECQQLLLVAFQQAEELSRVLDETAASYEELQETHQAAIDELNALKRWIYGRRTEKISEGEGQRHLFDSHPPAQRLSRSSRRQNGLSKKQQDIAAVENSISISCRTIGTSMTSRRPTSSAPAAAGRKTASARTRAGF